MTAATTHQAANTQRGGQVTRKSNGGADTTEAQPGSYRIARIHGLQTLQIAQASVEKPGELVWHTLPTVDIEDEDVDSDTKFEGAGRAATES
jgi:hypothetical protein